jgi:hypothetical protein
MRSGEAFAELDNQNGTDVEKELKSLKRERKRWDRGGSAS